MKDNVSTYLPMPPDPLPKRGKPKNGTHEVLFRGQRQGDDACSGEGITQFGFTTLGRLNESPAEFLVSRVDRELLTCLGVLYQDNSDIG
jgi:hypothetical protein